VLFRSVIAALRKALAARREHFRTVCVWQLNDNTREGIAYFTDVLLAEGFPECYANNLGEIFGPAGLVRSDADATPKPAFHEFKKAVAFFADARRLILTPAAWWTRPMCNS